jgi:two-component system, OmpR family, response regulator CpxR
MRPKKIILLVDSDEERLSVARFLLTTHSYKVVPADTGARAWALFKEQAIDLVLMRDALSDRPGFKVAEVMKAASPYVPVAILATQGEKAPDLHLADAVIDAKVCSEELLSRIKGLSVRKRGPRKGSVRVPAPELATAGAA